MTKVPAERDSVERFDAGHRMTLDRLSVGQWYWVTETVCWDGEYTGKKKGGTIKWLGCAMEIGSNYVEIHSPRSRSGYTSVRVHFDNFDEILRYEPDAESVIASNIEHYRDKVRALLNEVQEVTRRLGVAPTTMVSDQTQEGSNALVVMSATVDTTAYKNALVEAKEKTLPDLFKAVEEANENLARWMAAPSMPTIASIGPMKQSIRTVEDRIYTLELYAGLTEDAVKIRDGDPAGLSDRLHIMQRRLYMDEECLARYEAGGMEIKDIHTFDEWLSRPDNFERILPFDRSVVAFRVRRNAKDREHGGNIFRAFVNIQLAEADKRTFLYIRNGAQLWRIDCDFDFGEKLVPDQTDFDPSQPLMMKKFGSSVESFIPRSAWEVMRDEELEKKRLKEEWDAKHPKEEHIRNPYGWMGSSMRHKEYEPFDPSSVYFDQALALLQDKIKEYNRVAVILQGLFDRSLVLHPHNPVRIWEAESFAANIEVVYDATTLTYGDAPDFEAYRERLNSTLDADSIVTGQEDFWLLTEAVKENKRQENDWRNRERSRSNYTRFKPYGNPGPGLVGSMAEWKPRARKAVFKWEREKQSMRSYGDRVPVSITVPATKLLNVSAYKPGDFRQFFEDPRTRVDYLKWAPLLLVAEDYHAGKLQKGSAQTTYDWIY